MVGYPMRVAKYQLRELIGSLAPCVSLALLAACGSSTGSDAGGDAGPPDSGPPPLCDQYCDAIMANCTGANVAYADKAACKSACASLPATGMDGDMSGNTVQCRIYHAGVAKTDPATHCPHAAENGGDVCGSLCDVYCDSILANCTTTNKQFDDKPKCMAACSAMPKLSGAASISAMAGDSVQCRIYHAGAAKADAHTHCPHAGTSGGGVCGMPCDAYCDQVLANCTMANNKKIYDDRAGCMATCANFPGTTSSTVTSGDSAGCRIYHASFPAKTDPATHCNHVNDANQVCGGYCNGYCDQILANCTGANMQYADRNACMTMCATFPVDGAEPVEMAGNNVQCRAYHASFPAATGPALHCPHAGPTGGGVCQ
jgi:hypothetical protein